MPETIEEKPVELAPSKRARSYTCGLIFDIEGRRVMLKLKNRPQWQAGKYNGVGGTIEDGETPQQCMEREADEELAQSDLSWEPFAVVHDDGWSQFAVYFFRAATSILDKRCDIANAFGESDEPCEVFAVDALPDTIANIPHLIQMALNIDKDAADFFDISECRLPEWAPSPAQVQR